MHTREASDMDFPELYRVRRRTPPRIPLDVESVLQREIEQSGVLETIRSGSRVVIAAGSRGITGYQVVINKLVQLLKEKGAGVSILPAMGSHGGGDGPGQVQVLAELGITSQTACAPIVASMEIAPIGETPSGIPVFADKTLVEADHVILANRIKDHTEFHGGIQSGLLKMMAIGFGRYDGAVLTHKYAVEFGYERAIREVARKCMEQLPILAGIALIDDPHSRTAEVHCVLPSDMEAAEERLLSLARENTLKLPADPIDILLVDEMGKNISGTGMDTKVIGRIMNIYEEEVTYPRITRIVVRDLTPETAGNAIGIGLADFTTQRLVDKTDFEVTNLNCIAAVTPEKGRIPVTLPNDRRALTAAMQTIGPKGERSVRLVWIRNTSSLVDLMLSTGALETLDRDSFDIVEGPTKMEFDCDDNLVSPWLGTAVAGGTGA